MDKRKTFPNIYALYLFARMLEVHPALNLDEDLIFKRFDRAYEEGEYFVLDVIYGSKSSPKRVHKLRKIPIGWRSRLFKMSVKLANFIF